VFQEEETGQLFLFDSALITYLAPLSRSPLPLLLLFLLFWLQLHCLFFFFPGFFRRKTNKNLPNEKEHKERARGAERASSQKKREREMRRLCGWGSLDFPPLLRVCLNFNLCHSSPVAVSTSTSSSAPFPPPRLASKHSNVNAPAASNCNNNNYY